MIGVFGSGSWATAVAKIVLEHPDTTINWWIREPEIIEGIKETGHNPIYLSEVYFDTKQINFSNDISEVIKKSDDLLFVVPSAFLDDSLQGITPEMLKGKNIHSAIKGVVLQTNQIVADYFHDKFDVILDILGELKDYCSIRINNQWRIQFKFQNNEAYEVQIVDYH